MNSMRVESKRRAVAFGVVISVLFVALITSGINVVVVSPIYAEIAEWAWFLLLFNAPLGVWIGVRGQVSPGAFASLLIIGAAASNVLVRGVTYTVSQDGLVLHLRAPLMDVLEPAFGPIIWALIMYLYLRYKGKPSAGHEVRQTDSPDR